MQRIAVLEQVCELNFQALQRLTDYIKGDLSEAQSEPFARLTDPAAAVTKLSQSIRRIVALQDKLDQDDETRETRRKAEQAARRQQAATEAHEDKKETIRKAVRNIHRDAEPDQAMADREQLLDDLFRDYEDHFDYEGDPAEIVAQLCHELGLDWIPPDDEDDPAWTDGEDCLSPQDFGQAGPRRLAQDYLDALRSRDPPGLTARNGHDPP